MCAVQCSSKCSSSQQVTMNAALGYNSQYSSQFRHREHPATLDSSFPVSPSSSSSSSLSFQDHLRSYIESQRVILRTLQQNRQASQPDIHVITASVTQAESFLRHMTPALPAVHSTKPSAGSFVPSYTPRRRDALGSRVPLLPHRPRHGLGVFMALPSFH